MANIFEKNKENLPSAILDNIKKESEEQKLSQSELSKLIDQSIEEYREALISPGEAIGIITAESIGEPSTQMALDVFHLAGVAEVQVTRGLPRLIEIFDARKETSTPSMTIAIKPEYTKDEKTIKRVASHIKEMTLKEITEEFAINALKGCIEVTLDNSKMKLFGFTIKQVADTLKENLKTLNIKETKKGLIIEPPSENQNIIELYKVKVKVKDSKIRGIEGITQVLPIKKLGKYIILCAGSNLKEVLNMKEVDAKNTTTNNIFEISKVLGIEAARQAIINEAVAVLEHQGLDIDIRHMMLLADIMTHTGAIKGVTRGGITGEKQSVFARASFETPIDQFIKASMEGERDHLRSVIENVIVNQPIPLGTGLPGLVTKMKKKGAKK
ncbi:MAG: DNA-directed RNA polymerase subunit A'' [Candidatus Woesearchaeota archaeon]